MPRLFAVVLAGVLALRGVPAGAASTGIEGQIGITAGFNSNPLLLTSGARSSTTAALQLDAPLTYVANASVFTLRPRLRYGTTSGDVAVLDDYQYLEGTWNHASEVNELTASADWRHDSTLYNQIENGALPGYNLHRTEELGSLGWQHAFSERVSSQVNAAFDHVSYAAAVVPTLSSFNYGQASAGLGHALSEQWQLSLTGGVSRYELRDHSYRTDATSGQLEAKGALSERWSLTAQFGYARLRSRQTTQQYFLEQLPDGSLALVQREVNVDSSVSTEDYGATVARHYERWQLELSAIRSLQPSGLGALLLQDDFSLKASGDWTERLNLSMALRETTLSDPSHHLTAVGGPYYYADFNARWQWTEKWIVELQTSFTRQRLSGSNALVSNAAAYLSVSRQFGRKQLL